VIIHTRLGLFVDHDHVIIHTRLGLFAECKVLDNFQGLCGPRTRTCKLVLGDLRGQRLSSRTTTLLTDIAHHIHLPNIAGRGNYRVVLVQMRPWAPICPALLAAATPSQRWAISAHHHHGVVVGAATRRRAMSSYYSTTFLRRTKSPIRANEISAISVHVIFPSVHRRRQRRQLLVFNGRPVKLPSSPPLCPSRIKTTARISLTVYSHGRKSMACEKCKYMSAFLRAFSETVVLATSVVKKWYILWCGDAANLSSSSLRSLLVKTTCSYSDRRRNDNRHSWAVDEASPP